MTSVEFAERLQSWIELATPPDMGPKLSQLDTAYRLPTSGGLNTTRFTVQLGGETFVVEVWARGG